MPVYISPNGDGRKDTATISLPAAQGGAACTVSIVERRTATRCAGSPTGGSAAAATASSGTVATASGAIPPDGSYYLRVILVGEGRGTITRRGILLVTKPTYPKLALGHARTGSRRVASQLVSIRFTGPTNPKPLISVLPHRRRAAAPGRALHGRDWARTSPCGTASCTASPAPPGTYAFAVTVQNKALVSGSAPRKLPPTDEVAAAAHGRDRSGESPPRRRSSPCVPARPRSSASRAAAAGCDGASRRSGRAGRCARGRGTPAQLFACASRGARAPASTCCARRAEQRADRRARRWRRARARGASRDHLAGAQPGRRRRRRLPRHARLRAVHPAHAAVRRRRGAGGLQHRDRAAAALPRRVQAALRPDHRRRARARPRASPHGPAAVSCSRAPSAGSRSRSTLGCTPTWRAEGASRRSARTRSGARSTLSPTELAAPSPPQSTNALGEADGASVDSAAAPLVVNPGDSLGLFAGTDGFVGPVHPLRAVAAAA